MGPSRCVPDWDVLPRASVLLRHRYQQLGAPPGPWSALLNNSSGGHSQIYYPKFLSPAVTEHVYAKFSGLLQGLLSNVAACVWFKFQLAKTPSPRSHRLCSLADVTMNAIFIERSERVNVNAIRMKMRIHGKYEVRNNEGPTLTSTLSSTDNCTAVESDLVAKESE